MFNVNLLTVYNMQRGSLRIEYSRPNFQTTLFYAVAEIPLEQVYEEIKTVDINYAVKGNKPLSCNRVPKTRQEFFYSHKSYTGKRALSHTFDNQLAPDTKLAICNTDSIARF